MKNQIARHLDDPGQLEHLYRSDKTCFKEEFSRIYPEIKGTPLADFWNERLSREPEYISWGSRKEVLLVLLSALVAGLFSKLPAILPISEEFFYPRNAAFLIFPFLCVYFAWKKGLHLKKMAVIGLGVLASLIYINVLPDNSDSDTLILACIHLPLLLWALFGFSFTAEEIKKPEKRLSFLRFNGDLAVMMALLLLAGGLMSGMTIALFELINFKIENFYFHYVVAFGLPSVPIVAAYLTQTNPHLVDRVSPVIAKIFSPLVLVMLLAYLVAIVISGKDPYNDRDFLLLFNLLLIGVMALIFFSVAETSAKQRALSQKWVLLLLSIATVVVNAIALSAIIFRISEWGITPNRLAVIGANILMLVHLLLLTTALLKSVQRKEQTSNVGKDVVLYLPVYVVWAAIVVFLFPVLFGFI